MLIWLGPREDGWLEAPTFEEDWLAPTDYQEDWPEAVDEWSVLFDQQPAQEVSKHQPEHEKSSHWTSWAD